MSFEPQITAFVCWKWGYGSADMAGTIRAQYPPTILPILVPCTARVSTDMVVRAFAKGADGVLIVAWYPGECGYETGNYHAKRLVEYLKHVLDATGIGGNRLHLEYCSAAEGQKFQHTATTMTDRVLKLGPNPLKALASANASAK